MKAVIAFAMLIALSATAQAAIAPEEDAKIVIVSVNTTIPSDAEGAIAEADYFRAPQEPIATNRIFPCRLQLEVFDKTRVAQSCH